MYYAARREIHLAFTAASRDLVHKFHSDIDIGAEVFCMQHEPLDNYLEVNYLEFKIDEFE